MDYEFFEATVYLNGYTNAGADFETDSIVFSADHFTKETYRALDNASEDAFACQGKGAYYESIEAEDIPLRFDCRVSVNHYGEYVVEVLINGHWVETETLDDAFFDQVESAFDSFIK